MPQTQAERTAAIQSLNWRDGQLLTLPNSQGTLKAPKRIRQLLGQDAETLWAALNGVEAPFGTEAALYASETESLVFFQKIGGGFVRLDDWGDVDADAMLKSVSENTEADNVKRRSSGLSALHVVGWLVRPQLDRSTNVVRWAFEATDEKDGALVNSVVLVLGRDGFEKLTWIGSKSASNDGLLKIAEGSFSFPPSGRYTDYQPGDKVAEYGIAGLVAAVLGVKTAAKVGLLAALAVFAKKFGVILVAAGGALLVWLGRLFMRKKQPSSPPPPLPPAS